MHRLGKLCNLQKKPPSTEAAYYEGKLKYHRRVFQDIGKTRPSVNYAKNGGTNHSAFQGHHQLSGKGDENKSF